MERYRNFPADHNPCPPLVQLVCMAGICNTAGRDCRLGLLMSGRNDRDAFPPGTYDRFVEAGTLLGYQGNYSADPDNPTGIHLHFSIVKDDGEGNFKNELVFNNTIDPSPYLGMQLNADMLGDGPITCAD